MRCSMYEPFDILPLLPQIHNDDQINVENELRYFKRTKKSENITLNEIKGYFTFKKWTAHTTIGRSVTINGLVTN